MISFFPLVSSWLQELPLLGRVLDEERWSLQRKWWLAGFGPHPSRTEWWYIPEHTLIHLLLFYLSVCPCFTRHFSLSTLTTETWTSYLLIVVCHHCCLSFGVISLWHFAFKAGWCFLSAWQSNWQNECLLFRWVLLWSVSSDGHQGGKSGSKVRRYLCIRWGERRHHLLDRPRRWPTEEGDWLLFWLTSYLLKLKSSNDHNDCSYCYSSKRTRELWGGTSAPKVFMVTSEKMSLCTTNILKVRWQGLHRGVELELQTFIAAILINLYWL